VDIICLSPEGPVALDIACDLFHWGDHRSPLRNKSIFQSIDLIFFNFYNDLSLLGSNYDFAGKRGQA